MRVAIYVRVSTDEQAKEGYSLGAQKEKLEAFCFSQGWEIKKIYIEEGQSAKDTNRPQLKLLMNELDLFDVALVYKLDRLSRSVADINELLQTFEKNGVSFKSATEPYDTTTAQGKLLINIFASLAQFEREQLAERVQMGMSKKANLGERNGGKAPFGYKLQDGKLIINEEEARYIRDIFRLYTSGKGMRTITLYLNQFGVYKDIRTVGRMLENPVYSGRLRWANNSKMDVIVSDEINHPPIIDQELFNQAQKLRNQRFKEGKKATSPYPFSGVLRCGRCGSPLSGYFKKARGTKHYICIAKKNKGTCDLPMFTEQALTIEFLGNLSADDPDRFFSLTSDFNLDSPIIEDQTQLLKKLEKELSIIKTRKKNWLNALGNGVISQEEYLIMTQEDSKKEKILKDQLEDLPKGNATMDRESIIKLLESISDLWNTATDFEKKSFINELFTSIIVDVPTDYKRGRGKTPSIIIKEFTLS
ncbi:recombinase family protein [Peribacillus simplex]|uniref:recombinase family protein n=1 Tax=Peribacillus simplex TaxID=1478 RepID=UPI002989E0AF|nr:recombinase family protein [Peribacillus simplex]MBX9955093.1 recombinase family protein [Peribacillus simplex]